MSKKVYYRYNTETDSYERIFPSMRERMLAYLRYLGVGSVIGVLMVLLIFYAFSSPTEEGLRHENGALRDQYSVLRRRLDNSLRVLEDIRARDDNFYRVTMQMDPLSRGQRFAGLDNEARYKDLQSLPDAELITDLTKRLDLLDRQLYAQSLSFDQLKNMAARQEDKLQHIPSVLPIKVNDYTMSSGYGYRRDPVYGSTKFHEGLDFAAPTGTTVFATADGVVKLAGWKSGYGNCIDIDHGYNYITRYAHLSKIYVSEGERVVRGHNIGEVGSTGKSTGSHLHYEVRFKDEPQNPVNYYFMDLTPQEYNNMIQMAENAGHVMD